MLRLIIVIWQIINLMWKLASYYLLLIPVYLLSSTFQLWLYLILHIIIVFQFVLVLISILGVLFKTARNPILQSIRVPTLWSVTYQSFNNQMHIGNDAVLVLSANGTIIGSIEQVAIHDLNRVSYIHNSSIQSN